MKYLVVLLMLAYGGAATADLNLDALESGEGSEPAAAEQAPADCYTDDERLENIGQIVSDIKADKPPKNPLTIRADRLINFNHRVLNLLGDHYAVITSDCQTIPVVDGLPIQRVPVDFPTLSNKVAQAVGNDQGEVIRFYAEAFRAAPVDGIQGFFLIAKTPYPQATQEKIAKIFSIQMRPLEREDKGLLLASDFFLALGGKVTDPKPPVHKPHSHTSKFIIGAGENKAEFVPDFGLEDTTYRSALNALGYNVSG